MSILFILQYIPYPLNTGGNQATFNMIDKAREEHHVSVLLHSKGKGSAIAIKQLQETWGNVTFYIFKEANTFEKETPNCCSYKWLDYLQKSFARKKDRKLKRFYESQNDFVRANSCLNKGLPTFTEEYEKYIYDISRKGFDAIQIEFYENLPLVHLLPQDVEKIYVQHEIRYIRSKNEFDLFEHKSVNDLYRWNLLKDFEVKTLSHYNHIIALTETDKELMLAEDPNLNIYVSPAAIKEPKEKYNFLKNAQELVFIGSGDHFPNADGIIWFTQKVLPLLQQQGFNKRVNIVGKWNKKLKQRILSLSPTLQFTGFIDDLSTFVNGKISIVPIRIGSGMRIKLLDSVWAASPIVTTSKGCEGLPFANEKNCLIADSAQDFANAIMQMLANKDDLQKNLVETASDTISGSIDTAQLIEQRMKFYRMIERIQ